MTAHATMQRWRDAPISFVEEVLCDPETGRPFRLLDAERAFMQHAFALDADGRLLYPEQCLWRAEEEREDHARCADRVGDGAVARRSSLRRSAIASPTISNRRRVALFTVIKRIVAVSPLLKGEAQDHGGQDHLPGVRCDHRRPSPPTRRPRPAATRCISCVR